MKILGVVSVVQQLFRVPLSILFLLLGYGVISLIWLHLITEILVSFVLYKSSQKIIVFNFFSRVKFLKEYIYSGMRFSLLEFFSILSGKVDLVMLSFLTTPANVGIYALAYRLVDKGLTLRGPISQSLFPYYADRFHKKKPQIRVLAFHTALISIPLIIFLIPASLLIKPIIVNIIGASFIESAKIFNVLVFYLILNFSVIPWGLYLQSTNNEKYVLYTATLTAFLNIALNILFFQLFGIIGIAYSTLLVQSINMITQQFLTVYQIKRQF
jgi:O-antigen/teichoic acid export membrane protein